jgi:MATE family multidrug resistance protein
MPLTAPRFRRIVGLAFPIIGAMVSQNVFNVIDTAMVARLGDPAIAAVGLGGMVNFASGAFLLAMGAGVQAMSARRLGEGLVTETALPLNGGLFVSVAVAVPWTIVLFLATPLLIPLLNDDPEVVAHGVPYVQARLLGMTAIAMNFSFRGYWNAIDRAWFYMLTLVGMHVLNVVLNFLLIYGLLGFPELGTTGAGIANTVAMWSGSAVYFVLGMRQARAAGFLRAFPSARELRAILRLSIPTGIQQSLFAGGMVLFYAVVGAIGTKAAAASTVIITLLLLGILPGLGFGLASMSLVGQALGRKDAVDARAWGWDVVKVAFVVVFTIGLVGAILTEPVLAIFLHDPETLALGIAPLRIVSITLAFDAVGIVLMQSLLGAGDNARVMMVAVATQWGLFLIPVAVLVLAFDTDIGLTGVWLVNVGSRVGQSAIFGLLWTSDHWTRIKL